jgi:hypothetical protein
MAQTINVQVRKGLRVHSSEYSDADVTDKIERALVFVNELTGETHTIADYTNATTTDLYYDGLITLRALWAIYLEFYNQTVNRGDGTGAAVQHISSIFRLEFLSDLAAGYPGLVKWVSGQPTFSDRAYAGQDVGVIDNRYDLTEAISFDKTQE